jgi:hypothetical protein
MILLACRFGVEDRNEKGGGTKRSDDFPYVVIPDKRYNEVMIMVTLLTNEDFETVRNRKTDHNLKKFAEDSF